MRYLNQSFIWSLVYFLFFLFILNLQRIECKEVSTAALFYCHYSCCQMVSHGVSAEHIYENHSFLLLCIVQERKLN